MSQGMDRIVNVQIIAPLLGSFWLVIALTVLLPTANLKEKKCHCSASFAWSSSNVGEKSTIWNQEVYFLIFLVFSHL